MRVIKYMLFILVAPIAFIITIPIELPLWKQYKKEDYNVPGYFKFWWYRVIIMKEVSYKKIKCLS